MEHFNFEGLSAQDKANYTRFMTCVEKRGNVRSDMSPCWLTTLSCASTGYGQISFQSKLWNTHRYSYYIHNNAQPLEDKKHICHRCDNKLCCNPEHLYQGTAKENAKDTWDRGLKVKTAKPKKKINMPLHSASFKPGDHAGEKNVKAVLTREQAIEILKRHKAGLRYGELKKIAEEYGIKYNTAQKLVAGDTWKDIDRTIL